MSAGAQRRLPLAIANGGGRFPGFDVMGQSKHWDDVTIGVVMARLGMPPDIRFFTPAEEATARSLCDQVLGQRAEPRVPVVNMIDARLAEDQTDGWHYLGMAPDGQAWRKSLAALDFDAGNSGHLFAELPWPEQFTILQAVLDRGSQEWHGVAALRVWSLWTRYACTAFYSDPTAWDEIGFDGPAYPRGYKKLCVDKLEPFEVTDARPNQDPLRKGES